MKQLIIDTDFETDCDDAGALAVAHALQESGKIKLAGVVASIHSPWPAAGVRAFNLAFNRPDVPVGTNRRNENGEAYRRIALDHTPRLYHRAMAERFPAALPERFTPEEGVTLYTRLLQEAPDGGVVICAIGLLTVLAALLDSGAAPLIARKVKQLVTMAEAPFPCGNDGFNWNMDRVSAQRVLTDWPTPVVVSPLGRDVETTAWNCGEGVRAELLQLAYRQMGGGDRRYRRASWGQLGVLYAAGELDAQVELSPPGEIHYDPVTGGHRWIPGDRKRRFLHRKADSTVLAALVQSWMCRACQITQEAIPCV